MEMVSAAKLVCPAVRNGYAVPAFCVWNRDTVDVALRAADDAHAPVILMHGEWAFSVLGPAEMAAVVREAAASHDVPTALHLDHGSSPSQVDACMAAGFTSVMLDCSRKTFAENVAALHQLVELARPGGISVEGELGTIGSAARTAGGGADAAELTDPDLAGEYVQRTGVDMLAVSIGNAHGIYVRPPEFDFERLARIRDTTGVPLVLHGGSTTPEEDLRKAVSLGIAKVNVGSELIAAARQALEAEGQGGQFTLRSPLSISAMEAVRGAMDKWFTITGAAGNA